MPFDDVVAAISVPKAAPADSFVLHAPLELMARTLLLRHVRVAARPDAEERIRALGRRYQDAGDPVEPPPAVALRDPRVLAARLQSAIAAGELDDVDAYAAACAAVATPGDCRTLLAPVLFDSVAAAGHGSILLHLLGRAPWVSLIRGAVREVARHPDWRIRWMAEPSDAEPGTLTEALDAVPFLGLPGSDFIYPQVAQVEAEIAPKLLAGALDGHPVEITRAAAWAMLSEPLTHAPYGWTHCLTIPQALLGLPLPRRAAIAAAATYVVAFRAGMGSVPLNRTLPAADDDVSELATRASLHEDAHYVKYTLACIDAAEDDRSHRALYLAAASRLADLWDQIRSSAPPSNSG